MNRWWTLGAEFFARAPYRIRLAFMLLIIIGLLLLGTYSLLKIEVEIPFLDIWLLILVGAGFICALPIAFFLAQLGSSKKPLEGEFKSDGPQKWKNENSDAGNHDMALAIWQRFFGEYREIKQTMISPKPIPISEDLSLKGLSDGQNNGIEALTRIYGVSNSIDLLTGERFLKAAEPFDEIEIRGVQLLGMPPKAMGALTNVTLGLANGAVQEVAISIPRLARSSLKPQSVDRAVCATRDEAIVSVWEDYFEYFLKNSEEFSAIRSSAKAKLHVYYRDLVKHKLGKILRKVQNKTGIEMVAAYVGSVLADEVNDWSHRDIDVLIFIPDAENGQRVEQFRYMAAEEIRSDFSADHRCVVVEFKDGPVKCVPHRNVETWQFHLLIDTESHAHNWPFHVAVRRLSNIEWLEVGPSELKSRIEKAIKSIRKKANPETEIITGGFGLEDCLKILWEPLYHYREVRGDATGRVIRRRYAPTDRSVQVTSHQQEKEQFWRVAYLAHYAIYNFCFNAALIESTTRDNLEDLVDGARKIDMVVNFLKPYLSNTEYGIVENTAKRIERSYDSVREELIFPQYSAEDSEKILNEEKCAIEESAKILAPAFEDVVRKIRKKVDI